MTKTILMSAALLFALSGCDSEEGGVDTDAQFQTLSLELDGLEDLGDGFVYEGWVMLDGAPVSTGRFDLADVDSATFEMAAEEAERVTAFVLTIEPAEGDDPAPSNSKVLAGDFSDGEASLSVSHEAALGTDFGDAMGAYILETPTSAEVSEDYNQGVWFVDPAEGMASLDLPALGEGWIYEGWVVGMDGPISTGQFTMAEGADSDGAGEAAGPDDAPPFPGQDFIDPAMDLLSGMVVISVEPVPDDSPAPFAIKPLIDSDVEDSGAGTLQDLELQDVAALYTGMATFQ